MLLALLCLHVAGARDAMPLILMPLLMLLRRYMVR